MTIGYITLIVVAGVALLLLLILKFKLNAFVSLLIASIFVGVLSGMPLGEILKSIQNGMGNTLGFVAVVVGLGAIFGQMLESSGGAHALATHLLGWFGPKKASWAMVITGFLVSIPVFFDVGLIILVPMIYALSRDAKRSLLFYGMPLIAGMGVTHAFIPPTPGPIAVADILGAELGWVIFFGVLLGFPAAVIAGPVFGNYIARKINIEPPESTEGDEDQPGHETLPPFSTIAIIISLPLVLILLGTLSDVLVKEGLFEPSRVFDLLAFLGHPFSALIIATLTAIVFCTRRGMTKEEIMELSTRSLGPAGIIILVTGAGGVLKQVLIDSGVGQVIADAMAEVALPAILLAWILAALVRATQGSATVAMITAAGIMAPILPVFDLNAAQVALVVIAISSGGTAFSHVNDSGFWMVSRYFGMTEAQTIRSWTVASTIIGFCGLILALLASLFV